MTDVKIIVGCLSALVSMALVLVIFGQHQALALLLQQQILQDTSFQQHIQSMEDSQYAYHLLELEFRNSLTDLKGREEESANLEKIRSTATTRFQNCQGEKTQKEKDMTAMKEDKANYATAYEKEAESWSAEIENLNQQMQKNSKICAFVKQSSVAAKKLCPSDEATNATKTP